MQNCWFSWFVAFYFTISMAVLKEFLHFTIMFLTLVTFLCVYSSQNYTKIFVAFLCNFLHCLIEADLYCVLCVAVLVATRIYILQIKMTNSPISPLHPSHYNIFLTNLRTLKTCGDSLFHGGCNQIAVTLHTHLNCIRFDRTIFNFPRAGFLGKETDSGLTD